MLRKLFIYAVLAGLIGAVVYGVRTYAVVALYDKETPKVTYLFVLPKPQQSFDFFFNHIDRREVEREIAQRQATNQPIPWHMNYEYVVNQSIYHFTLDATNQAK